MTRPFGSKNKIQQTEEVKDQPKIVPRGKDCKDCQHDKELHYEGPKGWCNFNGCSCQEHKN